MTQVEMGELLQNHIVPKLEVEFNVHLIDGFHPDREFGRVYKDNDYFYNVGKVATLEMWKPKEKLDNIICVDLDEVLSTPQLGSFILDKMRNQIKIWQGEVNQFNRIAGQTPRLI